MSIRSSLAEALRDSAYELITRIRSGAMGTVHVGQWRGAPGARLFAIKRLHPHLDSDPGSRRSMELEAAFTMRLRHPNVVASYDLEDLEPEMLLVMEYIEGTSLAEMLHLAPLLPEQVAVRIVLDVAEGLSAVHAMQDDDGMPLGLVHRDVAPDNILVGLDGRARISDFGVATTARARAAEVGVLKGRFGYMAPEYLMAYPTDSRADVFSLGVVAWELLVGRSLFKAATDSGTMQRIARYEPQRISSVAPELGKGFDRVFERVLAKNPAHRFPTVEAFAEALAAAAQARSGIAAPRHLSAMVDELAGDLLARRRSVIDERCPVALHATG